MTLSRRSFLTRAVGALAALVGGKVVAERSEAFHRPLEEAGPPKVLQGCQGWVEWKTTPLEIPYLTDGTAWYLSPGQREELGMEAELFRAFQDQRDKAFKRSARLPG